MRHPRIEQPPGNTVTLLGNSISLNCTAEGYPAPSYEWYKDGELLHGEIQSILHIPEPSPGDRGNYTCKAINSEGKTNESPPAKLDIAGIGNDVHNICDTHPELAQEEVWTEQELYIDWTN